jgi:hypothetical protein
MHGGVSCTVILPNIPDFSAIATIVEEEVDGVAFWFGVAESSYIPADLPPEWSQGRIRLSNGRMGVFFLAKLKLTSDFCKLFFTMGSELITS